MINIPSYIVRPVTSPGSSIKFRIPLALFMVDSRDDPKSRQRHEPERSGLCGPRARSAGSDTRDICDINSTNEGASGRRVSWGERQDSYSSLHVHRNRRSLLGARVHVDLDHSAKG